jgi:hypothetical protein
MSPDITVLRWTVVSPLRRRRRPKCASLFVDRTKKPSVHARHKSFDLSGLRPTPLADPVRFAFQEGDGPFLEIGRLGSVFFTLSRNAVFRSVGRPCFFNKSLKASSASSWKSIMRSRASRSRACHVQSSNWTRFPGITGRSFPLALFVVRSIIFNHGEQDARC